MNFEIERGINIHKIGLPNDIAKAYVDFKNCIYERLRLFNDEAALQPDGYVMLTTNPAHIDYRYTGTLGAKMKESISEEDYDYCRSILADFLSSLS